MWVPTTVESKSQTCWDLDNSAKPQERLKATRAEQVAATHARLQRSGADRGGDPGAGYGPRRECKFDLANQNDNEKQVAENRGHIRSPSPEYPKAVDMCRSYVLGRFVEDVPVSINWDGVHLTQLTRQDEEKERKRLTVNSG